MIPLELSDKNKNVQDKDVQNEDVQDKDVDFNVIRILYEENYEDEDKVIQVLKIENDNEGDDENKASKNAHVMETLVSIDLNVLPVTQERPVKVSSIIAVEEDSG